MRDYEIVMIISPEVAEEDLSAVIDKANDQIASKGGEIMQVDQWGKRKLAYPIQRFMEGNYVLSRFKFEPAMITDLEADLRISENILRHMIVRLGD